MSRSCHPMDKLAARVSSKLEEGNYRGAVRLACSENTMAEHTNDTLEALRQKHPPPHCNSTEVDLNCDPPLHFTIDTEQIKKVITSFPNGSGGGHDGLLPQHLKDLTGISAGDGGALLLKALAGLITLMLGGRTPNAIRPLLFGANLIALRKKEGGIRPIAIGCTIRRLASKCACLHALNSIPDILSPHQLGFGVSGGAEAAVHASRVYLNHLPSHKAILKVDFRNAFNCIRRDKILEAIKEFIPELLPYVHSAYSAPSILLWEGDQIKSSEGVQQGDPIGPLLFCITIHKLVSSLTSEFSVFYLDDGTIGGNLDDITADLKRIEEQGQDLGLYLNVEKSELISHNQSTVDDVLSTFPGLQFVHAQQATLLGSPLGGEAMDACLDSQLHQLKLIGERLCHFQSHDAFTILRHSFALPKLLHILRTSPAFSSPHLLSWDNLLMSIVSRITNIDFHRDDPSWLQATLPVGSGGLGLRSASHLAPSAFLASADGASRLMHQLLPHHLSTTTYTERNSALSFWREDLPPDTPLPPSPNRQKSWDKPRVEVLFDSLLRRCSDHESRARLLAAGSRESGAWLNAPPVSSLGLRMSNDMIRISIGLRVGAPIVQPHTCVQCGKEVDHHARHGLSCKSSQGRLSRHNALNNVIYRSLVAAKVPSRLEPSGLHRSDGKRPDGMTMVPWSEGKFLVWDSTCVDTFCSSNHLRASREPGGAAAYAEQQKVLKYIHLDRTYQFQPVAVETGGSIGPDSKSFLLDLGRRLKMATGEPRSYAFLLQRISVAIQTGNASSVLGSLPTPSIPFLDENDGFVD